MLLQSKGDKIEVGIDEAGRGCLAGPVVAAAVVMPIIDFSENCNDSEYELDILRLIKDSKKMTKKNRAICKEYIEDIAIDFGVGIADSDEIDTMNILRATHKAMHRGLNNLNLTPDLILVDGNGFTDYYDDDNELVDHKCVIGGDNKYFNIACASVLAKEYHDQIVKDYVKQQPELDEKYNWLSNVCYGTKSHLDGVEKFGLSKYHRKSFGICKGLPVTC